MIYRLVYQITMLLLKFLNGVHPKLQKGYQLRQKKNGVYPWLDFPKHTEPLWFHCASGEFEYALPLIRKIKEKNPNQKILVTYFTPSYLPRLTQEKLVDYLCPSPWDKSLVLQEFIEHHKPKALLIARTDIWSEMTEQCYRHKVPTMIFSMTFNKTLNPLSHLFYAWQFRFIDRFFVVADEDQQKLRRLIPDERIFVCGDTRYEQCLYRLEHTASVNTKMDKALLSKKVFVAGSLWPEDEVVILDLLKKLKGACHWVLVPHEIHNEKLNNLATQISALGETVTFSSQTPAWNGQGVLIINEFGLLAHLYKIADLAFVGGSFRRNVHSVMEPLATGCLTYVGPHYHNSREAEEFSKLMAPFHLSPVQVVNRDNVESLVLNGLEKWTAADAIQLREFFHSKAQATDKILKKLEF